MDLSTDADFLSGALQLVTGERIVSQGKDGGAAAGSFDLDCLHKRSLQWRGGNLSPPPATASSRDKILEIIVKTLTGKKIPVMIWSFITIR